MACAYDHVPKAYKKPEVQHSSFICNHGISGYANRNPTQWATSSRLLFYSIAIEQRWINFYITIQEEFNCYIFASTRYTGVWFAAISLLFFFLLNWIDVESTFLLNCFSIMYITQGNLIVVTFVRLRQHIKKKKIMIQTFFISFDHLSTREIRSAL